MKLTKTEHPVLTQVGLKWVRKNLNLKKKKIESQRNLHPDANASVNLSVVHDM